MRGWARPQPVQAVFAVQNRTAHPSPYPSIHVYFSEKSNQKYGTYISTIKILSGATRHSSVITTPLKGKE